MHVLLTGANGLLGRTLVRRLAATDHVLTPLTREDLELTDGPAVEHCLLQLRPQVIVHTAAMTAVDRAESEPELAWAGNALASTQLALAAFRASARLIALSTDYVFAGDLDRPYHEWDQTGPATAYGRSKLAAEQAIRSHCPDHTIIRTAWLYGPGGPSFVHTLARLAAQDGPPLPVVDDQVGNPTSTDALADLILTLLENRLPGIVHGACSGETTWYGFARALAARHGWKREIVPCTTAQFPRPAQRPRNSRLAGTALRLAGLPGMPPWDQALDRFCTEFPHG